jgi:uncharacterized repeat protein (TIGR03803 family)
VALQGHNKEHLFVENPPTSIRPLLRVCVAAAILTGCGLQAASPPTGQLMSRPAVDLLRSSGYRSLFTFNGTDGAFPWASLIDVNGEFYGTTYNGGANGAGTVFEVSTSGSETVVYSFKGTPDGAYPQAGLLDVNGELYGTTPGGGSNNKRKCGSDGCGTVFKVTTSGQEQLLYKFNGGTDGGGPSAGLIDVKNEFYGTTSGGGASDLGTVFKISTSGKEQVIYSFKDGADGAYPSGGLLHVHGELYGTTSGGGASGWGTVFQVSTFGTEQVLYSFKGGTDGEQPRAGLIDVNGELYGTTYSGGGAHEAGTVFEISTTGKERVLHRFTGSPDDGSSPQAGLVNVNDTLYGTTSYGGVQGTVFAVTTSGKERVLYRFGGTNGANPYAGLIDVNALLYGTALHGGSRKYCSGGCGTMFRISP